MDRKKAEELLKIFGRPVLIAPNGTRLVFARQNLTDIEAIEKTNTKELVKELKGLVWMNQIYGQVSLNEMQRIGLIELELESRKYNFSKLKKWYDKEELKQQKREIEQGEL